MKELINVINNKSQLIMIGGRPAVGKTTLSLQFIIELAKYDKCLIYSLEMGAQQIESKVMSICKEQNYDYSTIKNNIVIDDGYNLTSEKLKEDCLKNNYKYVLIDYLQLVDKIDLLNELIKGLKAISQELDLTIILNSMVHRDCIYRPNKEILLKDFRIENIDLIDKVLVINESDTPFKKFELYNEERDKTNFMYSWNDNKLIFEC